MLSSPTRAWPCTAAEPALPGDDADHLDLRPGEVDGRRDGVTGPRSPATREITSARGLTIDQERRRWRERRGGARCSRAVEALPWGSRSITSTLLAEPGQAPPRRCSPWTVVLLTPAPLVGHHEDRRSVLGRGTMRDGVGAGLDGPARCARPRRANGVLSRQARHRSTGAATAIVLGGSDTRKPTVGVPCFT